FLAGALFCQSYFDGDDDKERQLRALVDSLTARADWNWASPRPPAIGHGWTPEQGPLEWDWKGYNEAMIVYVLALGAPAHAASDNAWDAWTSHYKWGSFQGEEHLGFAPLFGHQYTHVWVDFRGIQDAPMREHESDYFENSRRATRAQRAYAMENPQGWTGYGADLWGLTACDGPVEGRLEVLGKEREFHTYWARGAAANDVRDDGTIAPTAAGGSIAFEPQLAIRVLRNMAQTYGEPLYSKYGFLDAFNPSFLLDVKVQHGHVVPPGGWFDTDYLGIDQGPILAMIENARTGLVWNTMRRNPQIIRGLKRAGFTGGWLDSTDVAP
ncbi:MAG TPA: glucoamylase family protein, partial [bacterium]|nr:glucoamylase family protein [bacterium]